MDKQIKEWFQCWEEIEKKYRKMHNFKFGFLQGKIKYYYKGQDKKTLSYKLHSINEALVTHQKKFSLFFKDLLSINFNYSKDWYIFSNILTIVHHFIEDIKNFWNLFNKIYNKKTIFTDHQIEINFEIFKVINLLRKFVDHSTSIKTYLTDKELIKNSNYLKFKGEINNIEKLYLNQIHISLGKNLEFPFLNFIHENKTTGILYFNEYKFKIIFNTHQIIDDLLRDIDLYLINCIKISKIMSKNKIKYLRQPKVVHKNPNRKVLKLIKNKDYDFNHPDNPFYDSNLKNSWTLIIERKEKEISKQIKLRKEFIITYQYANEKPRKIKGYGIKAKHKGCAIGKLMDDLLDNNDKITFKNLINIKEDYDIPQPDFLLISLFFSIKNVDEKYITKNYLTKEWFLACGTKDNEKEIIEWNFPWDYIERHSPFKGYYENK